MKTFNRLLILVGKGFASWVSKVGAMAVPAASRVLTITFQLIQTHRSNMARLGMEVSQKSVQWILKARSRCYQNQVIFWGSCGHELRLPVSAKCRNISPHALHDTKDSRSFAPVREQQWTSISGVWLLEPSPINSQPRPKSRIFPKQFALQTSRTVE